MNRFKQYNTILIKFTYTRKVKTYRYDTGGGVCLSEDMERHGYKSNTLLTDSEIADLVRKLKEEGYIVELSKSYI